MKNRKAHITQVLAFCEYGKKPIIFTAKTEGTISLEKNGEHGWFFDFIFIPKGQTKTLACFPNGERFKLWNDTGYQQLAEHLKKTICN